MLYKILTLEQFKTFIKDPANEDIHESLAQEYSSLPYFITDDVYWRKYTREEKKKLLIILALDKRKLLGFYKLKFIGKRVEFGDFYIVKKHRDRGLSYAIIGHALILSHRLGIKTLTLFVHKDNLLAIKIYQKMGWVVTRKTKKFLWMKISLPE